MDPTTKWMLITGAVGAGLGGICSRFYYNQITGFYTKGLLVPPVVGAVLGAGAAWAVSSATAAITEPRMQDPAAVCATSAPAGKTAVYTRNPDGSFSCTYKPS